MEWASRNTYFEFLERQYPSSITFSRLPPHIESKFCSQVKIAANAIVGRILISRVVEREWTTDMWVMPQNVGLRGGIVLGIRFPLQ